MKGAAPADAPAIAAVSEITFPGETLIMTGVGLEGATLEVWAEGRTMNITPMRSADDRLQALVPADAPKSCMLVWPEKDGKKGAPIRVNGPVAWWRWPPRVWIGEDTTVRVFGKSLSIEGADPVVCLRRPDGRTVSLEVVRKTPYHVEAALPRDLTPGGCHVWVHNGTGGVAGWSDPTPFEAVAPVVVPDRVFRIEDYDPPRGRAKDKWEALDRAIRDCAAAGGGTIQFAPEVYVIKRKITLPEGVPIVLRGAGMGDYDVAYHRPGENGTVLTDWVGGGKQNALSATGNRFIEMLGRGCRIEDMTVTVIADLNPGFPWEGACVYMGGPDQVARNVRVTAHHMGIMNILCGYEGVANQRIENCELYMSFTCVRLGALNDYVRIANCVMRGHFRLGRGATADAVHNSGMKGLIVEDSDFASEDPDHGKVMSRTVLCYTEGAQFCYLANNHSENVGARPSVPGMDGNVSEQYLFHGGRDRITCRVAAAEGDRLEVVPEPIEVERPKGTQPASKGWLRANLPEPGEDPNLDWTVFVSGGRGLGQYRVISRVIGEGKFEVTKPWRVAPDAGSIVFIMRAHRNNIVTGNTIVPASKPEDIVQSHKNTGVFVHDIDSVIAGNHMENIGQGLAVSGNYDLPVAWNLFRDNTMVNVTGNPGGTAPDPTFFTEHVRLPPSSENYLAQAWTLGNICRANRGRTAGGIGTLGWYWYEDRPSRRYESFYRVAPQTGMIMTVFENNDFQDATRGLILSEPLNWTVVRNNILKTSEPTKAAVETHRPDGIFELLLDQAP